MPIFTDPEENDPGLQVEIFMVATEKLRDIKDPFADKIWGPWSITLSEVAHAIERDFLSEVPYEYSSFKDYIPEEWRVHERQYHVARIAYLVVNPSPEPIEIEVFDSWGSTRIEDGHHRLAAAIFREDAATPVSYGGYISAFRERFLDDLAN